VDRLPALTCFDQLTDGSRTEDASGFGGRASHLSDLGLDEGLERGFERIVHSEQTE